MFIQTNPHRFLVSSPIVQLVAVVRWPATQEKITASKSRAVTTAAPLLRPFHGIFHIGKHTFDIFPRFLNITKILSVLTP